MQVRGVGGGEGGGSSVWVGAAAQSVRSRLFTLPEPYNAENIKPPACMHLLQEAAEMLEAGRSPLRDSMIVSQSRQ